jgi:hypothetical protein
MTQLQNSFLRWFSKIPDCSRKTGNLEVEIEKHSIFQKWARGRVKCRVPLEGQNISGVTSTC